MNDLLTRTCERFFPGDETAIFLFPPTVITLLFFLQETTSSRDNFLLHKELQNYCNP